MSDIFQEFWNAIGLLRCHLDVEQEMDLETYNLRRGMVRSETGEFLRRVYASGIARGYCVESQDGDGSVEVPAGHGEAE